MYVTDVYCLINKQCETINWICTQYFTIKQEKIFVKTIKVSKFIILAVNKLNENCDSGYNANFKK